MTTNTEPADETFRLCCPECGFETPPFDYSWEAAEKARKQFQGRDCPDCDTHIETLAVFPVRLAETEWEDYE